MIRSSAIISLRHWLVATLLLGGAAAFHAFAADSDKQKQWSAFVRRIRIDPAPAFGDVVARIERFAMPMFSAALGAPFKANWSPNKEWMG